MSKLENLVPPLELCKLIPQGEFADSMFTWWQITPFEEWNVVVRSTLTTIPAPTLQEILEELHKQQEDVFLKWSEHAYHEWLVNAYTNNEAKVEDYQVHDINLPTAALKLYLQLNPSDQSNPAESEVKE